MPGGHDNKKGKDNSERKGREVKAQRSRRDLWWIGTAGLSASLRSGRDDRFLARAGTDLGGLPKVRWWPVAGGVDLEWELP
jgi:hypothetical protein